MWLLIHAGNKVNRYQCEEFQVLSPGLGSTPELELELKPPELELELIFWKFDGVGVGVIFWKFDGVGVGVETPGVGVGIRVETLGSWSWSWSWSWIFVNFLLFMYYLKHLTLKTRSITLCLITRHSVLQALPFLKFWSIRIMISLILFKQRWDILSIWIIGVHSSQISERDWKGMYELTISLVELIIQTKPRTLIRRAIQFNFCIIMLSFCSYTIML